MVITGAGAGTYISTSLPFSYSCNANNPNLKVKTNYFLVVQNTASPPTSQPNYIRTFLSNLNDEGYWGNVSVANYGGYIFGLGQTMCNMSTSITFLFPATLCTNSLVWKLISKPSLQTFLLPLFFRILLLRPSLPQHPASSHYQ